MLKRLAPFFAVLFIFVQSFALLHTAEYGFQKHGHHGKVCELCVYSEHQHAAGTSGVPFAIEDAVAHFAPPLFASSLMAIHPEGLASPRAPPALLIS